MHWSQSVVVLFIVRGVYGLMPVFQGDQIKPRMSSYVTRKNIRIGVLCWQPSASHCRVLSFEWLGNLIAMEASLLATAAVQLYDVEVLRT